MQNLYKVNLISLITIVRREWVRILRIWPQTILPPVVTTSLYFFIFGQIIGSRVGNMEGTPFIDYIVPGLILMGVINNSYTNTASSFFGSKFQRNVEELLVSPTSNWVIIMGYCIAGVLRGLLVGFIIYLVSLFFTTIYPDNILITVIVAFMTALLFSFAGMINGVFARKFDDISIIPSFVLTPMIYLGGVFYNVELLSGFWQKVTYINPIFYMVNAFRYGMLEQTDINIGSSLLVILIFTILLFACLIRMFKAGIGLKS